MLWPIDSCQKGLQLVEMTRLKDSNKVIIIIIIIIIGFQLITGSGPFSSGGIQFVSCLWQKLNYCRKKFLERSYESFAFGLC